MTPCQKLLKQEGTVRRIESMQQSSETPKTQDVGWGLWKIVNPPRSAFLFQQFLAWFHPYILLDVSLIFADHKHGQDTVGLGTQMLPPCADKDACALPTKRSLRHPETPVELSVSLSDSCSEFACDKGSSTIGYRANWCANHSLQSYQSVSRPVEEYVPT